MEEIRHTKNLYLDMPPCNYKLYAPNWKTEIRPAILKRSKNRCEQCRVKNGQVIFRGIMEGREVYQDIEGRIFDAHTGKYICTDCYAPIEPSTGNPNQQAIKVVLTIAHTCHDPKCNDMTHLKALCQMHHLRLDVSHHKANRRATRAKKMGLQDIFDVGK